jgi:hypothetical protein
MEDESGTRHSERHAPDDLQCRVQPFEGNADPKQQLSQVYLRGP